MNPSLAVLLFAGAVHGSGAIVALVIALAVFAFGMTASVPNRAPNVITAAGAVTPSGLNSINAAGALALTLAAPTVDGQRAMFTDETGHAHTITTPANVLNGAHTTLTFGGTAGQSAELFSRNGKWWAALLNGVTVG